MEVNIISREIIKPSSPTPNHLRSHKISHLDQLNINSYFPMILFYSGVSKNNSHHLKKSLSETLTHYYPLAGRVKDHLSVDCDDYGVYFVEADVAGDMSDQVLKQPEPQLLEQLMPCKPPEQLTNLFNLAIQVSYFGCGGVAICVCFRHVIADATAAANFIKSWATTSVACGGNDDSSSSSTTVKDVIFDCTSLFPPQDWPFLLTNNAHEILNPSTEMVTKRFVFDKSKIAALRGKIGNGPTRFEAMFALLWSVVTTVTRREGDEFLAAFPVSIRKKMNPPISEQCIGNICTLIMADLPTEETTTYNILVEKVRELISMVNEDYVKKASPNGWILNCIKDTKTDIRRRLVHISSACRLPWYEADFGWGKPIWVAIPQRHNEGGSIFVALLDTCDGGGVEAWIGLSKEEMTKFQQHSNIIAYTSF
ncbi:hypothetical protein ACOSP7_022069 [Xanthoceras sorbifolium]